jgi:glycosyltransferase involved in cell wall biosynthesis
MVIGGRPDPGMTEEIITSNEMGSAGLSVVLGTCNRKPFLKMAVDSIRKELNGSSFPSEIIVIDGGSTDGTLRWLSRQKDIITITQHNRGTWNGKPVHRKSWGFFMNLGFRCAHGKYICMLSDDGLVIPGAIINGYNLFEQELTANRKIGAVAFYWRDWPDQVKYLIVTAPDSKVLLNHGIFLRKALADVGYSDENHYLFYHADSDLCLRIWENGYEIIPSSESYIEHYPHANLLLRKSNFDIARNDYESFYQQWKEKIGLSRDNTDPWIKIEKEFHDPHRTVRQFRFQYMLQSWFYAARYCYRRIRKKS